MQCVPSWSTTICRAACTVRTDNLLLHCRPCDKPLPTMAPGRCTNYTYIQLFAHPQAGACICLPDPAMSYAMALHCVTANAAQDINGPADMHALCAVQVHSMQYDLLHHGARIHSAGVVLVWVICQSFLGHIVGLAHLRSL